jgi:hypothetical protein
VELSCSKKYYLLSPLIGGFMKKILFFITFSALAFDKIALPEDFGTWNCGKPFFTKLGRCEMQCGGDGCKVICK